MDMGCCYGTETEAIEPDDPSKPLILPQNQDCRPVNSIERNPNGPPSCPTDEQALLSSILAKTALNIIDVSASDFQGIEQREYMDKTRQYSHRLAVMSDGLSQRKRATLPSLTSQPHKVLASDLVSHLDLQQVSKIAAYAHSAISQIKVDAKEDLVVQFAIP